MEKRIIGTKRLTFILLIVFALAFPATSQVTIGNDLEPNPNALLDLMESPTDSTSVRGLALPRVTLTSTADTYPMNDHVAGMFIYSISAQNDVTPGVYYNDGEKWVRQSGSEWFYLPGFTLDLNASSVNLYTDVYAKQFKGTGDTPLIVSANDLPADAFTTATNRPVYTVDQLVFVVTYYDDSVIDITSIDATGKMSYTAKTTSPPEGSYFNIICVVK